MNTAIKIALNLVLWAVLAVVVAFAGRIGWDCAGNWVTNRKPKAE